MMRFRLASFVLSILLVLYLLAMSRVTMAQTATPAPRTAVEACRQLMQNAVQTSGPNAPRIRIVDPADNGVVYGSKLTVAVQTENFEINADAQHWHLWVNGQLQTMVYGPGVSVDLAPGVYQVCVILGNNNHQDVGIPDGITVTLQSPQQGTPTSTPAVAPSVTAAAVAAEQSDNAVRIGLLVVGGLLAAILGWRLGARLPKGKRS